MCPPPWPLSPVVFLHLSPSIGSCVLPEFLSVGVSASQHLCFPFSLKLVLEQFGSGVFVWWWKSVRWKSWAWNTGSRCGQRWSGARPTVHRPGAFRSWELGKENLQRDQEKWLRVMTDMQYMFCTWVKFYGIRDNMIAYSIEWQNNRSTVVRGETLQQNRFNFGFQNDQHVYDVLNQHIKIHSSVSFSFHPSFIHPFLYPSTYLPCWLNWFVAWDVLTRWSLRSEV